VDASLIPLVLLAALLHASWNALLKVPGDALARLALINLTAAAVAVSLLPWVEPPAPASWPFLLASAAVHLGYSLCLVGAYREGDLSLVYPLARGAAPILVVLGAWLLAGERLPALGIGAVLVISAGILALTLSGWRRASLATLIFAFATGACIVGYTLIDGLGARRAESVMGYVVWLFVIDGIPLALAAWYLRRRSLAQVLRSSWAPGLVGGVFSAVAYGVVIWAMTRAPMGYVSALRETSVVLAALIGTRLLREPLGSVRVSAAVVVALGVAVLQLAHSP
jgi:drug/metabolite transporter (DMT)-like permease